MKVVNLASAWLSPAAVYEAWFFHLCLLEEHSEKSIATLNFDKAFNFPSFSFGNFICLLQIQLWRNQGWIEVVVSNGLEFRRCDYIRESPAWSLLGFEIWRIILASQGKIYGTWGEKTVAQMKCDILIRCLGRLLDIEWSRSLMGTGNPKPSWLIITKCMSTRRWENGWWAI